MATSDFSVPVNPKDKYIKQLEEDLEKVHKMTARKLRQFAAAFLGSTGLRPEDAILVIQYIPGKAKEFLIEIHYRFEKKETQPDETKKA